ncbi:MAG: hypothetical protein Q7U60_10765 [Candidatus Methanoperedens sp.]|nr:hypothetical protein [Candidatus Methanoperedens sp.]
MGLREGGGVENTNNLTYLDSGGADRRTRQPLGAFTATGAKNAKRSSNLCDSVAILRQDNRMNRIDIEVYPVNPVNPVQTHRFSNDNEPKRTRTNSAVQCQPAAPCYM